MDTETLRQATALVEDLTNLGFEVTNTINTEGSVSATVVRSPRFVSQESKGREFVARARQITRLADEIPSKLVLSPGQYRDLSKALRVISAALEGATVYADRPTLRERADFEDALSTSNLIRARDSLSFVSEDH